METTRTKMWTAEYWNEMPYMSWAGARILSVEGGVSRIELQVKEHHRGGAGTDAINGAILAYLHDVAQGAAVRSLLDEDVKAIATLNINVSYVTLTRAGNVLHGEGRAIRAGVGVAFAQSEFRNDAGDVCCRASGTFRIFRAPARMQTVS
jgi:uncharacterized protein (TIGR00369 family)